MWGLGFRVQGFETSFRDEASEDVVRALGPRALGDIIA